MTTPAAWVEEWRDKPFQSLGNFDQVGDLGIFHLLFQARFLFEGLVDGRVQLFGNQLGDAIDSPIGNIQTSADIANHALGRHGAEGNDLADVVAAIFLCSVFDHLRPAVHAEIHVDVGRGDAFGIQKTFEKELVLQRIDIGDAHAVGHQAAYDGAAARADRNGS